MHPQDRLAAWKDGTVPAPRWSRWGRGRYPLDDLTQQYRQAYAHAMGLERYGIPGGSVPLWKES